MHYHDGKTEFTAAKNYRDLDGNIRSFDYIDHDKKTKISLPVTNVNPHDELKQYKKELQQKILALPASCCPDLFSDFKQRIEENKEWKLVWNESMILDEGVPLNQLRDIYTLTSNRYESVPHSPFRH